jgi:hypothetical protein
MQLRRLGLVALTLTAGTLFSQTSSKPEQIRASGCVRAGVEGNCIVLTDSKSHKLYNLFFASDKKPPLDAAISFVGTTYDGMTTCMEGTPVQVKDWKPVRMKCTKEASGEK